MASFVVVFPTEPVTAMMRGLYRASTARASHVSTKTTHCLRNCIRKNRCLPIRRDVVVVYQEFGDVVEGACERGGGVLHAVRFDCIQEDDEFRVVRRKVAEKLVQIFIRRV